MPSVLSVKSKRFENKQVMIKKTLKLDKKVLRIFQITGAIAIESFVFREWKSLLKPVSWNLALSSLKWAETRKHSSSMWQ